MNDFTFEYRKNDAQYETFEWDNLWIDHANDKTTKRVLYIGDSISVETRKELSKIYGDKVRFDGFATSKSVDNPYFKDSLTLFSKQLNKTDVILFNNGLHGWHLDDESYGFYYREMVKFLVENFKNIPVYIVLTTYVKDPACTDGVVPRNNKAKNIAHEFGLSVIDLYTVTKEYNGLISDDNIHLTAAGYLLLAEKIKSVIDEKADFNKKPVLSPQWNNNFEYLKKTCINILGAITQQTETEFGGERKTEPVLVPTFDKYPSIWVRDVAMNIECGLVDAELIKKHIVYFAKYAQNGSEDLILKNNLVVPAWTVADHLNYNGKPVYYPGTYSDGNDQGTGEFGYYPSMDDNYYLIHMVYVYIKQSGDYAILDEECIGMTLADRMKKAWEGYHIDEKTDLCYSHLPFYTVDWGFTDSIVKSGLLMFPSLLRYQSAVEMSELCKNIGDTELSEYYITHADRVKNNILKYFWDGSGWLYSATELCHQYDVWGTAYAIYIGILPKELEKRAVDTIADSYKKGHISVHGYLRMIRTVDDDKFGQSWQATYTLLTKPGNYQNGGYWASASGWLFYALYKSDVALAEECIDKFVKHTKQYEKDGAPFEFINKSSTYWEGKLAGTCATLPYAGAKRIYEEIKHL